MQRSIGRPRLYEPCTVQLSATAGAGSQSPSFVFGTNGGA